jgi:hypothetical protein
LKFLNLDKIERQFNFLSLISVSISKAGHCLLSGIITLT